MDEAWVHSLPALCRNRKYVFEEMHAVACPSPRPVAVTVSSGPRKLPIELWPAAEFIIAALQGEEVFQCEACNIETFLLQLLCKAIVAADALGSRACLGPKGLLSLFAARGKRSATVAKPSEGTTQPARAKSMREAVSDEQEARVALEAELAPGTSNVADEPAKVEAARCADENAPQVAEMALEERSGGQACVFSLAKHNGEAEGEDECATKHEGKCSSAAAELEEGPSQEVKMEDSVEPARQETGKQRRRKKRRERLRQKAKA